MSRRKPLVVTSLGDDDWADRLRTMRTWLEDFVHQPGEWIDAPTDPTDNAFHRRYERRVGKGAMSAEIAHVIGTDEMILIPLSEGRRNGRMTLPMRVHAGVGSEEAFTTMIAIIDRVLGAEIVDDVDHVDAWSMGIAGITANLGAKGVDVSMPFAPGTLIVYDPTGLYSTLPGEVRRRISLACPYSMHVTSERHEDHPSTIDIEIGGYDRTYEVAETGTGMTSLSSNPIAVMRSIAMVLEAAGLTQKDVEP
jgi:hypothetical protein